jgi:formylglycine-generating enzyme required for sulfatase activity
MATPADDLTLHRYKCTNKGYTEDLSDGVTLTLMLIPAGEFMMGAPENEPDSRDAERPQHRVKLLKFLMGRYPVTQAQWRVVAGYDREEIDLNPIPSNNFSNASEVARVTKDIPAGDVGRLYYQATQWNARSIDGSSISKGTSVRPINRMGNTWYVSANSENVSLPVEQVNWNQAVEFCKRLSKHTGKNYHLPSEAQWEYACRAGTETPYHYGDKITTELANYSRAVGQTTSVGRYPPNRWGLYDMHGNVEEWCQDYWHENYEHVPFVNQAWLKNRDSSRRVVRSSSWIYFANSCRSAFRYGTEPVAISDSLGFRVCCSVG